MTELQTVAPVEQRKMTNENTGNDYIVFMDAPDVRAGVRMFPEYEMFGDFGVYYRVRVEPNNLNDGEFSRGALNDLFPEVKWVKMNSEYASFFDKYPGEVSLTTALSVIEQAGVVEGLYEYLRILFKSREEFFTLNKEEFVKQVTSYLEEGVAKLLPGETENNDQGSGEDTAGAGYTED